MSSRDYVMITLAVILYGFGFSAFILPEKVVIGGVTGVGTIVYFLTGNVYMIGITQYAINLVLLAIAWRVVGHTFVYKTIYGATAVSLVVTLMPSLFDGPLIPDQPLRRENEYELKESISQNEDSSASSSHRFYPATSS